jgi:ABC-type molybdate transport system substrate-binding protein
MRKKGRYQEIPANDYPALEQAAVILRSSRHKELARQFLAYLETPQIQDLMKSYGFAVPTAAAAAP